MPPDHSKPVAGVLDLRNWDFSSNRSITLNGEWAFYPHVLLYEQGSAEPIMSEEADLIRVPGQWRKGLSPVESLNYGSYRLRILVNPEHTEPFGLRVSSIESSSEIYVNGDLKGQLGQPATDKAQYKPLDKPYIIELAADQGGEIDLVIHVADYETRYHGGIVRPIKFGAASQLNQDVRTAENVVFIACVVYLLHAIYSLILYFMSGRDRRLLYFMVLIICVIMATLIGERLLFSWFPFNYSWGLKVTAISVIVGGLSLVKCIEHHLPTRLRMMLIKPYSIGCGILILGMLILPASIVLSMKLLIGATMLIPSLLAPLVIYRTFSQGKEPSLLLLLAIVAAIYSLVWLVVLEMTGTEIISYPFDLMIALICFAAYWFRQYFRILTQSQQTALELQQADKDKDEFLAAVAHEMKNPLHGILNLSQTMISRENSTLEPRDRQDLKLLISVGHHMSMLINDLLDLTRLRHHRLQLRKGRVSIYDVVEIVIDMLHYLKEGKSIQLHNRVPHDFPRIYADENRVFQIMFNLLDNAVKHAKADQAFVYATHEEGWAKISVVDNGKGIEEAHLDKIFEPYERELPENDHVSAGIGLGLSVSQQLAQLHGGKLEVFSKVKQGTTFTLSLKLLTPSENTESDGVPPQNSIIENMYAEAASATEQLYTDQMQEQLEDESMSANDTVNILAVDDDLINLKVLANILSDAQFNIYTTTSGEEALAMLEKREWDLVLADIMMPNMSGYELTRAIRKRFTISELPILLLTARDRSEDIAVGFLSGANDYLKKPVVALELRARVNALTSLKRSVREKLHLEMAYLQAQIQPHFLFNTLNSIAALSEIDVSRMHDLLGEFGNYLKASFDFRNLERVVPIEHELKLVRSYLYIEKERFAERLQVQWDLDYHLPFKLPPLTIQPLVENAVRHGLLKRWEGGTVRISITEQPHQVHICVEDDGVGMNDEMVQAVYEQASDQSKSVGLYNTNRRLEQIYSKGLIIESEHGKGTKITFNIPR